MSNSGIYLACFPGILALIYPCLYFSLALVYGLARFLSSLLQNRVMRERRKAGGRRKKNGGEEERERRMGEKRQGKEN